MTYKKRFGDRDDGRRLRSIDPFFRIFPHIVNSRSEAQVFFSEQIDYGKIEDYIHLKRSEGIKDIGFLEILIAATIRTISQKPKLNRFIVGRKIYSRNEIVVSLMIKKHLTEMSPETVIKLKFNPTDTIFEVTEKLKKEIAENKKTETTNDSDSVIRLFNLLPGIFLRAAVGLCKWCDNVGILPKKIKDASPFHASLFVTDLGSIGIKSVYHHLYNFGTVSTFIAFGLAKNEMYIDADGLTKKKRVMEIRLTADERITDGYNYARAFQYFGRLMSNPILLEKQPKEVIEDIE